MYSSAFNGATYNFVADADMLTIELLDHDFADKNAADPNTKIVAEIWNYNEVKFSGTSRCVSCIESAGLSSWSDSAVNFFRSAPWVPTLVRLVFPPKPTLLAVPTTTHPPSGPSSPPPVVPVLLLAPVHALPPSPTSSSLSPKRLASASARPSVCFANNVLGQVRDPGPQPT